MARSLLPLALLMCLSPALAQEPSSPAVAEEAAALKARVASGALAPERLEVAAWLGHEPARVALEREEVEASALGRLGDEAGVRLGLIAARVATARWGGEPPRAVLDALAAGDAWVACPCPEHAAPCAAAVEAVFAVGDGLAGGRGGDDGGRRLLVVMAVSMACLAVERGPGELGRLVNTVVDIEVHASRASAPPALSEETQMRALGRAARHGGRGRTERPRDAVDEEVERWAEAMDAFTAACRARVLSEVRPAALPWLLGAP